MRNVAMFLILFSLFLWERAQAQESQKAKFGDWEILAFSAQENFGVCSVLSTNPVGTYFGMISGKNREISIFVGNRMWRIPPGTRGVIVFHYDNGQANTAEFVQTNQTTMSFKPDFSNADDALINFVNAFEFANKLKIVLPDGSVNHFSLRGSRRAGLVFVECIRQWAGHDSGTIHPPDLHALEAQVSRSAPQSSARSTPTNKHSSRQSPHSSPKGERESTGSTFAIKPEGIFVTNFHVVEACVKSLVLPQIFIRNSWIDAQIVRTSSIDDLAILKVSPLSPPTAFLRISNNPVRLGDNAYVYGFPLSGILADQGNFTQGSITALAGLRNDSQSLQISAPVQPGNSGGPLVDDEGNLQGIVVAKLDAARVAKATGDIPQNVNFAIKISVLVNLLEANGIEFTREKRGRVLTPPNIAERLAAATFRVRC